MIPPFFIIISLSVRFICSAHTLVKGLRNSVAPDVIGLTSLFPSIQRKLIMPLSASLRQHDLFKLWVVHHLDGLAEKDKQHSETFSMASSSPPTVNPRVEKLLFSMFLCCYRTGNWSRLYLCYSEYLKKNVYFHKFSITNFSSWLKARVCTFWHLPRNLIHYSIKQNKKYSLLLIILFNAASPRKDSIILGTRLQSNLFSTYNEQIQFPTCLF